MDEFVEKLFGSPVQPAGSLQIELEGAREDTYPNFMVMLAIKGYSYLYNRDLDFTKMTPSEKDTLNKYIESLGWTLEYTLTDDQVLVDVIPIRNQ